MQVVSARHDYLEHVKLSKLVRDQHERIARGRVMKVPSVSVRELPEARRVPQPEAVVVSF